MKLMIFLTGEDSDGIAEDGSTSTILGYSQTLTVVGTGATATAAIGFNTEGSIRLINISNRGGGYSAIPTIGVSSAPAGKVTGILTATMISGINVCNLNISDNLKSVQQLLLLIQVLDILLHLHSRLLVEGVQVLLEPSL